MPSIEGKSTYGQEVLEKAAKSDESTLDAILIKANPSKDGDAKLPV
jgi:hypothetical protein